MHRITFECETITPMFMAGADGKTPELRAPSIKGALRFWWRALNGHLELEELKKREIENFGGVSKKKTVKSPVLIRIVDFTLDESRIQLGMPGCNEKIGLKYFFHIHNRENKKAIKPRVQFKVEFRSKNISALNESFYSFWILSVFGGLGGRARRGGGSFKINRLIREKTNISLEDKKYGFWKEAKSGKLKSALKELEEEYSVNLDSLESPYSTLNLNKSFLSQKKFDSWAAAIDHIGMLMLNERKVKRTHKSDPTQRTFSLLTLDQKAAFGLPITVRSDNSLNFAKKSKLDRRASPIAISIIKLGEKYQWVLSHFDGVFAPEGKEALFFKSKNPRMREHDKLARKKGDIGLKAKKTKFPFDKVDNKALGKFMEVVRRNANVLKTKTNER